MSLYSHEDAITQIRALVSEMIEGARDSQSCAVLLVEPAHKCWGLYLSSRDDVEELCPGDWCEQNVVVGDLEPSLNQYPEREVVWDEFAEVIMKLREILGEASPIKRWFLDVDSYYEEVKTS